MSIPLGLAAVDEKGVRGSDELGVCDGGRKRLENPGRPEVRAPDVLDGGTNFLDAGVYYPWSVAWDLPRPASGKSVSITLVGICECIDDMSSSQLVAIQESLTAPFVLE